MPREHLPTAAGTFMLRRKGSDILKVQRWEAVRGHSSDLIQKKSESQKKTKERPLCYAGFQPEVCFQSLPSKFAAQGNNTCAGGLCASPPPSSLSHSRITCNRTEPSGGLCAPSPTHTYADSRGKEKNTVVVFLMIHPGV